MLFRSFLRHVQRTRVLIHVLDGMAEDPVADYSQTNSEMALFDPGLAQKPQLVLFNKMDEPQVQARWPEVQEALRQRGVEALPISALARTDLLPVLWKAYTLRAEAPLPQVAATLPVYRPAEDPREFSIAREGMDWRVTGKAIERAAEMTYWEYEGSVRRFQRLMEALGVDDALRKAGVQEGQTVFIGEYELEWQD